MNIVVCIKQVPDSDKVKVNPETGTIIRAGVPSILNPYDHFALENALKIKKEIGGKITVISMGPPQAVEVIKLALSLGADRGILLSDRAFAGSDTWATSYAISKGIEKIGEYDLILCGQMAIDGDTAQTGPGIAYHLNIPQITFCKNVQIANGKAEISKFVDGGTQDIQAELPALITMTIPADYRGIYPSFLDVFDAQDRPVETWSASDVGADPQKLGLEGSPTRVDKIYAPERKVQGEIFSGSANELAEKVLSFLKQGRFIK